MNQTLKKGTISRTKWECGSRSFPFPDSTDDRLWWRWFPLTFSRSLTANSCCRLPQVLGPNHVEHVTDLLASAPSCYTSYFLGSYMYHVICRPVFKSWLFKLLKDIAYVCVQFTSKMCPGCCYYHSVLITIYYLGCFPRKLLHFILLCQNQAI